MAIKKILLGLAVTTSLGLVMESQVQARTLIASSDWSMRKVDADIPYCAMNKTYEGNVELMIAKNTQGEGTVAFDFKRNAFDMVRPYQIQIGAGSENRQYSVRAVSPSMVILRLGQDEPMMSAIRANKALSVTIDDENFTLPLSNYMSATQNLELCIGVQQPVEPQFVETKSVTPPKQEIDKSFAQDTEIAKLRAENQRLLGQLATQPVAPSVPADALNDEIARLQERNKFLQDQLAQMERDLVESRRNINPDLSSVIAQKDNEIQRLIEQNQQLKSELVVAQNKPAREVIKTVEVPVPVKNDLVQIPEDVLREGEELRAKVASLQQENQSLRQQIENAEPVVVTKEVIKEVIKEVPVPVAMDSQMPSDVGDSLSEIQTQALAYKAERDEYQRLLQIERQRMASRGDVQNEYDSNEKQRLTLVDDVKRLEAEKADLIRQLEFAKSSQPTTPVKARETQDLNTLTLELEQMQSRLQQAESEKQRLEKRMSVIDAEAQKAQRQLAEIQVNRLANETMEDVQATMDAKSLRAEIASLEAQDQMLRRDAQETQARIEAVTQKQLEPIAIQEEIKIADARRSMPMDLTASNAPMPQQTKETDVMDKISVPVSENTQLQSAREIEPVKMVALSGDEIRRLLMESKIPLQTTIDRIDRVSGPDFAAFRWDTGMVYGSGEQARMANAASFENAVQSYIQKTASRCDNSFDQNIETIDTINGITVKAADIACVDENANGNAASILFFSYDGMFYALAHEADMDSFTMAMDMRDRLKKSITQIF
jgi:hypothetical protein